MPAEEFGRPETDAQHSPGPLGIFDKDTQRKRWSGKSSGPLADNGGFLDWMFRSRKNGRITLVQLPNWPLGCGCHLGGDMAGQAKGAGWARPCSPSRWPRSHGGQETRFYVG